MRAKYVDLMCCLLALLLSVLFAGCGTEPDRVYYKGGVAHFPLLQGRSYRYETRIDDETKEYTMTLSYIGGRSLKIFPIKFEGIKLGNCELQSQDTLLFFETDQPRTNLESKEVLAIFRELWIREGAQKGDSWENWDTGTQTLFAGYESVTVPAGTFSDCYKTVTTAMPALFDSLKTWHNRGELSDKEFDYKMKTANKSVARWFALNIGLVKEEIANGELVRELISLDQIGVGVVDTLKMEYQEIKIK